MQIGWAPNRLVKLSYLGDYQFEVLSSENSQLKEGNRFELSEKQAQAILDMRLRTLSGLQREKIEEEYKQLMELIERLRAILNSERLVFEIIKEELIEMRDKFGDERKTKIVAAEGEIDVEDLIKEEQSVIALTHFGYIKRMPIDTYKSQKRGGKGITGIATREEDFVKQIFTASTHDTILFFTNKGKLYKLRGYEIPEAGRTAKGTAIVNLLRLENGEKVSAVIPLSNFVDGKYLLMSTKEGLIKKTPLNEYNSNKKTGLLAITLKENDELIDVRLTDGEDNVVLVTSKGMCITFDEKDVRPIGRVSQGVIGIRIDEDDAVIGMESIIAGGKATLLAITENGFGKEEQVRLARVYKELADRGCYVMLSNHNTILVNELYKKLYSLEVLFGKYVDEQGFEDIKNQIRYYAASVVNLKNSISQDMVMDEDRLSENYNEEFAL